MIIIYFSYYRGIWVVHFSPLCIFLGSSLCASVCFAAEQSQNSSQEQTRSTLQQYSFAYAKPCEEIQPQSQLLKALQQKIASQPSQHDISDTLNHFWKQIESQGTPIVETLDSEHSRVIYLWRGAQHNVRLIGGPSNDHEWLTRLSKTDLWFKESIVDNRFIGSYRFAVDVPNLEGYLSHYCPQLNPELKESRTQRRAILGVQQLDPFNPHQLSSDSTNYQQAKISSPIRLNHENVFALSDAPDFIDPQQFPHYPSPVLKSYRLFSPTLGNDRLVQIYRSQLSKGDSSYITAIFFDGEHYAKLLQVAKALDILVKQGRLPPIQAIFLSHPSDELRPQELTPNAKYTQFFQKEFLPWLDQQLTAPRDPNKTVLLGSSLGGLSSAYLAFALPNQISHVVPMSGSFWWKSLASDTPNGMSQLIRQDQHLKRRFQHWYITANLYETSRNNGLSILDTSPIVANDLAERGHDVTYKQYVGGHSYAIWQVILQEALLHFFADSDTVNQNSNGI